MFFDVVGRLDRVVQVLEYRRNDYERDTLPDGIEGSVGVTGPRQDDLFGWSIGVGRALTRRGFVRLDYRRDKRDSSVPNFENKTNALIIQVGFGYMGSGGPP